MIICTVATHNDYYYQSMIDACDKLNLQYKVLGYGEKWENYYWKFTLMKEYLQTLDENEIIVFIDAFDVLPLLPENEILKRFLNFNKPIVVSSEKLFDNYLMNVGYTDIFSKAQKGYCNSGAYMGYVKYLLKMFETMDERAINAPNDQIVMSQSWDTPFFTKYVELDVNSEIFLTLRTNEKYIYTGIMSDDNKYYEVANGRIQWKVQKPAFVHGPSGVNLIHFIVDADLKPPIREPSKYVVFQRFYHYFSLTKNIKYITLIFFIIEALGYPVVPLL